MGEGTRKARLGGFEAARLGGGPQDEEATVGERGGARSVPGAQSLAAVAWVGHAGSAATAPPFGTPQPGPLPGRNHPPDHRVCCCPTSPTESPWARAGGGARGAHGRTARPRGEDVPSSSISSRVAQRKRAGPITQRSMDRNHPLLVTFCCSRRLICAMSPGIESGAVRPQAEPRPFLHFTSRRGPRLLPRDCRMQG